MVTISAMGKRCRIHGCIVGKGNLRVNLKESALWVLLSKSYERQQREKLVIKDNYLLVNNPEVEG